MKCEQHSFCCEKVNCCLLPKSRVLYARLLYVCLLILCVHDKAKGLFIKKQLEEKFA